MKPKDKYTMFDRKAKKYRKGVHSELLILSLSLSFFECILVSFSGGNRNIWGGMKADFVLVGIQSADFIFPFFNFINHLLDEERQSSS